MKLRKLTILALCCGVFLSGGAISAQAHTSSSMSKSERLHTKKQYYHANGVIKWIGKHAKVTQYHPNPKKRHYWTNALHFYLKVRKNAWNKLHPKPHYVIPLWALNAFSCIHRYEGAWNANTGNGYYGGLQMDLAFQARYGPEFLKAYGTADNWPIADQLIAAYRAYVSGRGFYPWPNTARACGLI